MAGGDPHTTPIIERLEAAGWLPTASGRRLGWANLTYRAGRAKLEVEYLPALGGLLYRIETGEQLGELKIVFGDRLGELLDLIVRTQDTVDGETWDAFMDDLLPAFPLTYRIVGDGPEDLRPLTTEARRRGEVEQDEGRILALLGTAGWERSAQSLQLGTASLAYDNGAMLIEVEQDYGRRELIITLTAPSGLGLTLFADYGDGLVALLEAIVADQDALTTGNVHDHIRRWLTACPDLYWQQDEDGEPRRLTPG